MELLKSAMAEATQKDQVYFEQRKFWPWTREHDEHEEDPEEVHFELGKIPLEAKVVQMGSQTIESTYRPPLQLSEELQSHLHARWLARLQVATRSPKGKLDGDDERHAAGVIAKKLNKYVENEHSKKFPSVIPTPKERQELIDRCEARAQSEVREAKEAGGVASLRMLLRLYS